MKISGCSAQFVTPCTGGSSSSSQLRLLSAQDLEHSAVGVGVSERCFAVSEMAYFIFASGGHLETNGGTNFAGRERVAIFLPSSFDIRPSLRFSFVIL